MKLTKAQRAAIDDAAGPRRTLGFGCGFVNADPRTVCVLVRLGLAHKTRLYLRDQAYLTRAGWRIAGKEPDKWTMLEPA